MARNLFCISLVLMVGSVTLLWGQGVPEGSEFQINTYTAGYQWYHSVAMSASGDFVVVWDSCPEYLQPGAQDGSDCGVFGQRFSAGGVPQDDEFQVNIHTTGNQHLSAVAMNPPGDFVVVWSSCASYYVVDPGPDGSDCGVFGRQFDSTGAPKGGEIQLNTYTTGSQWFPAVAMDSSENFVVVWESVEQGGIVGGWFNNMGVLQSGEFMVDANAPYGDYQSIAMWDSGEFIVAWEASSTLEDIFVQRFDTSGNPQGATLQVNTYTTAAQRHPDVAVDGAGNFVVVWDSEYQDGSYISVFGQRFNSTGSPQGDEFPVNTYTTEGQAFPAVAMNEAGQFVVSWTSGPRPYSVVPGQDGDSGGVFGQWFDGTGSPQGAEFQVNTHTALLQAEAAVATDGSGRFVVVWGTDVGGTEDVDVKGQRYSVECAGLELCDGMDNDCDEATPDGTDEPWLDSPCDGADSDLCEEGTYSCTAGAQVCSDATGSDLEVCDGVDNDCNPATADGDDEAWLGAVCDGTDSDFCAEGSYLCDAGSQVCSDVSGDNIEVCDGADNDCNGQTDEGCPEGNQPAVAICGTQAHYAWVRADNAGANPNIVYRNCTIGGACTAPLKLVGASTAEAGPAVACDGSTVLVAWEDRRNGTGDIAYRRSTNGGTNFDALQFLVQGPNEETQPELVMSGDVAIALWVDTRRGNKDLGFRRSTDGGVNWGTFGFLVRSPFDESDPSLTLDSNTALLSWVDRRHGNQDVAYRRSADAGQSWAGLTFLVRAPTLESHPTATVDGTTGTVLVAWVDERNGVQDLAARRSTDHGVSFAGLTVLVKAPTNDAQPTMRVSGDSALLAWVDARSVNQNISFRRSADAGLSWGATARLVSVSTDEFEPACDLFGDLGACVWSDMRTGASLPKARHSQDGGVTWGVLFDLD